ncbi:hypothetical protein E3N88_13395 [Mikania micrantha]|uniref:Uncharacterized protein n=1 Tax=Mikania micrantha TaxID=192012 RepID=A0A5N6PB49_9ASTR|nr:hypothetical protein E3N88_13395 [Mikania micrantha]
MLKSPTPTPSYTTIVRVEFHSDRWPTVSLDAGYLQFQPEIQLYLWTPEVCSSTGDITSEMVPFDDRNQGFSYGLKRFLHAHTSHKDGIALADLVLLCEWDKLQQCTMGWCHLYVLNLSWKPFGSSLNCSMILVLVNHLAVLPLRLCQIPKMSFEMVCCMSMEALSVLNKMHASGHQPEPTSPTTHQPAPDLTPPAPPSPTPPEPSHSTQPQPPLLYIYSRPVIGNRSSVGCICFSIGNHYRRETSGSRSAIAIDRKNRDRQSSNRLSTGRIVIGNRLIGVEINEIGAENESAGGLKESFATRETEKQGLVRFVDIDQGGVHKRVGFFLIKQQALRCRQI